MSTLSQVMSKLQSLAEEEVDAKSFTSRGETLGSLSHISLLEIITKARGRPNGYRKVIKACLFSLGFALCVLFLRWMVLRWRNLLYYCSNFIYICVGMQIFISWNKWCQEGSRHHRWVDLGWNLIVKAICTCIFFIVWLSSFPWRHTGYDVQIPIMVCR